MTDGALHLTHGTESPKTHTPVISLLLAYSAMPPTAAGAIAAWAIRPAKAAVVARLTIGWAGAILCFLAGVRRGLSFRQKGGSTAAQLASMFWLFVLGAAALLSPRRMPALVLLLLGYASETVLGPVAAERDEAPRYFARLRPVQMLIPIGSLAALLLWDRYRAGRTTGDE